jgi:hypothetical protein
MKRRGDRLRAFAAAIFDARTMERVIDPAIADLQAEPFSVGRYLAVFKVFLLCAPEVSVRFGTAAVLSALATAGVVALLEVRPLLFAWNLQAFDARMLVYLIPQGLSIAVSVGLTLGVLALLGGHAISRRAVCAAIGVAMAVGVMSFVNAEWVTPPANQAFRVALSERAGFPPSRGFSELTFGELRQQLDLAARNPSTVVTSDLHDMAVMYQGRWAVSLAPLMFTIFALVLGARRPLARWTAGFTVCVVCLAYLLYLDVPNLAALDGRWLGGAAWYPLIALAIVIATMLPGSLRARDRAAGRTA